MAQERLSAWSSVGIDLFMMTGGGGNYAFVKNCYSHIPEIALLEDTTTKPVIVLIKSVFASHGIPDVSISNVVTSDTGPQFSGYEFKKFAVKFGFRNVTFSPHYPNSMGWWKMMLK